MIDEHPTTWTPERTADLLAHWNGGKPVSEIAVVLGLTRLAVESRIAKLRRSGRPVAHRHQRRTVPKPRHTQRRCLHCGNDFASEHIGNRICPTCLVDGPFTSAMV